MRDFLPGAADAVRSASVRAAGLFVPALRLGVTGLSGAGKTVFITALVRNLVAGGRLPFFSAVAEKRFLSAYLEPQPDDDVPRFEYEAHLAALARDPPEWPESTRRISQLRVTIRYLSRNPLKNVLGTPALHLDIVDYPGEWLIDLPMIGQSFEAWSDEALAFAREPHRAASAGPFLAFLDSLPGKEMASEPAAIEGARLFTAYLIAARAAERLSVLGPGRFLVPGEYDGSPLLTFFPAPAKGFPVPLLSLLKRRYESYKARVVRPFFRDHMSRLDRQIVLADALSAVDAGPAAVLDLERALASVLSAFRPGRNSWLSALMGRRIDRILFAATKADHLHHTSHDRLEAILRLVTDRAAARAEAAGADVGVLALAACRATREAEARVNGELLPCIAGTPLPGERLDGRAFDGRTEVAVFPGDLPPDPREVFLPPGNPRAFNPVRFPRFRPRRVPQNGVLGDAAPPPHIRLDRALEFLLSDWLA